MQIRDLTPAEIEDVTFWIGDAFDQYAPNFGDEMGRNLLRNCGKKFCNTIAEDTEVLAELFDLMESGCPPLPIVEFMLLCEGMMPLTLADFLAENGITKDVLESVNRNLVWMPEVIRVLCDRRLSGELLPLKARYPRSRERRRIVRSLKALPTALLYLRELLKDHSVADFSRREAVVRRDQLLVTFYFLLARFNKTFQTLSLLLKTMRSVLETVLPSTEFARRVKSLEDGALEKRWLRFSAGSAAATHAAESLVSIYIREGYAAKGKTMLECLQDNAEDWPQEEAKRLAEVLKLTDEQREEVLSILRESNEKHARAHYELLKRHGKGEISVEDIDSAFQQLGQSDNAEITGVLDASQREKFNALRKREDEIFAREMQRMLHGPGLPL